MQRSRSRLYSAAVAALTGLIVTASASFAALNSTSGTRWIVGPNDVTNSAMATDTAGWAGWSDAGPVQVSRVDGVDGRFAGSTALQVTRTATDGTWGEVLGDLSAPDSYFKVGTTYRMSVWVRDLTGSGNFGMLIANGNYIHRPSDDSVYTTFHDSKWHQLSKTFVATQQASADTKFYLGLPSKGQVNMQMTGAQVVSLTPAAATATTTPAPTTSVAPVVSTPTAAPTTPIAAPTTATTPPPAPAGTTSSPARVITFDGAAGSAPNSSDWNYEIGGGGWGHNELETYTNSTSNSYLDGNGHLVITARRQTATGPDGITRNYTSARLSTANKVVIQPGSYVEASITAPVGAGLWPAFWTVGANINQVGWPRSGEMDILESTGSQPTVNHTNLHMSRLSNPDENNQVGWGYNGATQDLGVSMDAGPHLYGVYFGADEVRFYIDHKLTERYTAAQAAASDRAWPFSSAQYLVLNVAVESSTPSSTTFPRSMVVGPIGIYPKMPF